MSGICGQFNLDDAPVAAADLRAMTTMLERRGPEGSTQWQNGPIGLGHTLLATTPEMLFERQPLVHADTGCAITADVRLDNRNELLEALALSERHDSIGDAELILTAYLSWGDACLDRLLGDFAFAIWDPRHRKLFCARDHFGMRPFYYHHAPDKRFLFASDPRAILVLPQAPYKISDGRIADFLVPELEWIDYTSTFYEGVFRRPPGHKATATPAGIKLDEYWKPEPGPELGPLSDEDYRQGFLEVFSKAVEARLRAPSGTLGSMMSGGIDSGSVVAVGKDILSARGDGPLHTYSCARHKNADCAESRAIHAAVTMPSIAPTLIHPDALHEHLDALISGSEEPFDGQCMLLKSIYINAQADGRKVILDGAGGDVVLNEGTYVVRLLRSGHLRLAMAEITAENRLWGETYLASDLFHYARVAYLPEPVRTVLRGLMQPRRAKASLEASLVSREFADSVRIGERFEELARMFPRNWTPDYAAEICNAIRPNVAGGRERYARLAAVAGTEARDPFLDKRVVEYGSRLPGHLKMKDGWYKMILRELMADRLPDEVRWARGKPHLGWLFNETVSKLAADNGQLSLAGLQAAVGNYVDSTALANAWRAFRNGDDAEMIHTAHILSVWLRENEKRPVVPE
jgi:asparagine synthase (glutamine-hydrolysing)